MKYILSIFIIFTLLCINNVGAEYLPEGAVSHWTFDDESLLDENTTNTNDLTNYTAVYSADGVYGGARLFDSLDYMSAGNDSSLNLTEGLSILLWAKPSATGAYDGLLSKASDVSDYDWKIGQSASGDVFRAYLRNNTDEVTIVTDDGVFNTGQWYYIAVTFGNGYVRFYNNGTLKDTQPLNGILKLNSNDLILGTASTNWYLGSLDEVRIYNRALTNDEINQSRDNEQSPVENTAPNITSYLPTSLTPNVYENVNSSLNATANQSSNWRIWLNGTHIEWQNGTTDCIYYNETWLNASSPNNVTFEAHNTSDNSLYDTITWDVNVLLNLVEQNITYYNPDNLTANLIFDLSNKTPGLKTINISYSGTNTSSEYCLCHSNGTAIQSCITATSEGETIWFNGTASRLPEATGYYINETEGVGTSTIIIPANSLGMFNNWTSSTTFSAIAINESNDVCYSYYNVTTGEWESYYVGYSWNANNAIGVDNSVMGFFDAQTTVTATIITPSSTSLSVGWNMLFVEGTDNETIADIKADIGANCTDVWWFNSTSGAYSNTATDTVQPNQGFLVYINTPFTWTRSDL